LHSVRTINLGFVGSTCSKEHCQYKYSTPSIVNYVSLWFYFKSDFSNLDYVF